MYNTRLFTVSGDSSSSAHSIYSIMTRVQFGSANIHTYNFPFYTVPLCQKQFLLYRPPKPWFHRLPTEYLPSTHSTVQVTQASNSLFIAEETTTMWYFPVTTEWPKVAGLHPWTNLVVTFRKRPPHLLRTHIWIGDSGLTQTLLWSPWRIFSIIHPFVHPKSRYNYWKWLERRRRRRRLEEESKLRLRWSRLRFCSAKIDFAGDVRTVAHGRWLSRSWTIVAERDTKKWGRMEMMLCIGVGWVVFVPRTGYLTKIVHYSKSCPRAQPKKNIWNSLKDVASSSSSRNPNRIDFTYFNF